jgi:hypothetical protein
MRIQSGISRTDSPRLQRITYEGRLKPPGMCTDERLALDKGVA